MLLIAPYIQSDTFKIFIPFPATIRNILWGSVVALLLRTGTETGWGFGCSWDDDFIQWLFFNVLFFFWKFCYFSFCSFVGLLFCCCCCCFMRVLISVVVDFSPERWLRLYTQTLPSVHIYERTSSVRSGEVVETDGITWWLVYLWNLLIYLLPTMFTSW